MQRVYLILSSQQPCQIGLGERVWLVQSHSSVTHFAAISLLSSFLHILHVSWDYIQSQRSKQASGFLKTLPPAGRLKAKSGEEMSGCFWERSKCLKLFVGDLEFGRVMRKSCVGFLRVRLCWMQKGLKLRTQGRTKHPFPHFLSPSEKIKGGNDSGERLPSGAKSLCTG